MKQGKVYKKLPRPVGVVTFFITQAELLNHLQYKRLVSVMKGYFVVCCFSL